MFARYCFKCFTWPCKVDVLIPPSQTRKLKIDLACQSYASFYLLWVPLLLLQAEALWPACVCSGHTGLPVCPATEQSGVHAQCTCFGSGLGRLGAGESCQANWLPITVSLTKPLPSFYLFYGTSGPFFRWGNFPRTNHEVSVDKITQRMSPFFSWAFFYDFFFFTTKRQL